MYAPSSLPMTSGRKPHGSRAATMRVPGEEEQRERAHHLGEAGRDGVLELLAVAARVEMEDDLGVGGGLEDRARRLQPLAQHVGVHDVAVVGEGDRAAVAVDEDRLRVGGHGVARGRVADVADGAVAAEAIEGLVGEDVVHQAHGLVDADLRAVGGRDAGRLLAAVLERVEAEVGQPRRLGMAEDPEQAAVVPEMVVFDGGHSGHRPILRRTGAPLIARSLHRHRGRAHARPARAVGAGDADGVRPVLPAGVAGGADLDMVVVDDHPVRTEGRLPPGVVLFGVTVSAQLGAGSQLSVTS